MPKGIYKRSVVPIEVRFWGKVQKTNGCWLWLDSPGTNGYGQFGTGQTMMTPHRFSWSLAYGAAPDDMDVLRRCDTLLCVNPHHLFLSPKIKAVEDRFWLKVKKTEGCWIWQGEPSHGYGVLRISGKTISAHRLSWIIAHGVIPDELCVLHRCDVKLCVNPEHLFLGTLADNNADKVAKNRHPKGETSAAAKLTNEQVLAIRDDPRSCVKIAMDYGMGQTAIWMIKARKHWRHL